MKPKILMEMTEFEPANSQNGGITSRQYALGK